VKTYIRYNGFQDEIEIKEELNGEIKSLLKDEDYSVEYNDGEIHFMEFADLDEEVINGYLFSFYKGKEIVCYKRLEKKFKEGKKAKTSLQSSFPHRFIKEGSYVLGFRKGQLKQYKNTKKMVFSCLDDSKELKKYIKKNNLGFDDESNLKKILSYIDGQISN